MKRKDNSWKWMTVMIYFVMSCMVWTVTQDIQINSVNVGSPKYEQMNPSHDDFYAMFYNSIVLGIAYWFPIFSSIALLLILNLGEYLYGKLKIKFLTIINKNTLR